MKAAGNERLTIGVGASHSVCGLFDRPAAARAVLVLAHGAGAGMQHPSMQAAAMGLAERGIATLRYQFPYMERKSRRPDPPALCHETVRAAVAAAARLAPDLPLVAGGRSFGGRMTSQAQALSPLAGVRGLVFLAFPLHPAGRSGTDRAAHLQEIGIPMLFIQGSRDELADLSLLRPVIERLGSRGTLHVLEDADHSFHVPARGGRKDSQVREDALDAVCSWLERLEGAQPS
ncbi:MAG: dienelactone hydrolase family protein [Gammaproteobacteria bacterium]|nr:dienelactone hydrolase family protein [Gammaproteobacteria bacterium]